MTSPRSLILRLTCLGVIFIGLAKPSTASAETAMACVVCTVSGQCPLELWYYDLQCQHTCGGSTYAGACWDDPSEDNWGCGFANAAVVCYEPQ